MKCKYAVKVRNSSTGEEFEIHYYEKLLPSLSEKLVHLRDALIEKYGFDIPVDQLNDYKEPSSMDFYRIELGGVRFELYGNKLIGFF